MEPLDSLQTEVVQAFSGNAPAWLIPVLTIAGVVLRWFEKRRMRRNFDTERKRLLNGDYIRP